MTQRIHPIPAASAPLKPQPRPPRAQAQERRGQPPQQDKQKHERRPQVPRELPLTGPPPAFQANVLDLTTNLDHLIRTLDAARSARRGQS